MGRFIQVQKIILGMAFWFGLLFGLVYLIRYKYTMSIEKQTKLNQLLRNWPDGKINSSAWLKTLFCFHQYGEWIPTGVHTRIEGPYGPDDWEYQKMICCKCKHEYWL